MKQRSKRYQALASERTRETYPVERAVSHVLTFQRNTFDETVECHLNLNLRGTRGNVSIRGSVLLPHPVSQGVTVAVLTDESDAAARAEEAGADMVGGKDLIEQIKNENGIDADVVIATPNFMSNIAPVAKILGPKGLMPSPKNGTTTSDVSRVVNEFKSGKEEFKMDKTGVVHLSVGKTSFSEEQIVANIRAFVSEVEKQRPEKVKGDFIKSAHLTLTHSPSVKLKV
jgi:large subunit ribosomal protein L1